MSLLPPAADAIALKSTLSSAPTVAGFAIVVVVVVVATVQIKHHHRIVMYLQFKN